MWIDRSSMLKVVCRELGFPVTAPIHLNTIFRRLPVALLTVGLGLVGVNPALADLWYQHYQKAQEALVRQEWEKAVGELNQAIQRRGDSGARVRTYGMRTTEYFPYLSLGVAYLNLEQPEAALQAFETEERLGAIEASAEARDRLEVLRTEAREAIDVRAEQEQDRIARILIDSVAEAEDLARDGRLDEAMVTLGRGLAVSPHDFAANELMERLRQEARSVDARREVQEHIGELVAEGSSYLSQGSVDEAANRFRKALDLDPGDSELQGLLEQAQRQLRQEIAEQGKAGAALPDIQVSLAEVDRLEVAGRLDEALTLLQSVLAVDPENSIGLALEGRLVAARNQVQREAAGRVAVETELAAASGHIAAGRFEESLSAANRALSIVPGDPVALELVTRSYRGISRALLGRSVGGNIPPAIRFADFREERADGTVTQVVREPRFRLTGMVIDNSPVVVSFVDSKDRELLGEVTSQQLGDFYLTEFQLRVELEVGPETLRLVAIDAENLSASSEYSVLYIRPRLRSPWLVGLILAVMVGAAAALLIRRSWRLARRRRRRFNPYVAGAPVLDEDLFFGRDQLLDRILQTIHNNSLLLYGERRIGKTSIQHHLKKRLLALNDSIYDFYPVYVDLQGTLEDRFFATIAEDVLEQLEKQVDIANKPNFEDELSTYSYRDLVRDLREVIRQLKASSNKRVKLVLLIDEVDELNDFDPRINQRLRSLFMKSFAESLVAVVSGVEIKKHWERVGSPWYNFFEEIEVLPLSNDDARNLIEGPIAGVLRIDEGVVERILDLTDKRPYLIQKMCLSLVNLAYERKQAVISVADVEAVVPAEAV